MVTDTKTNNNAKYLKKDVTYNLKFNLNHLIKLEPGFNAEIEIKNSQNTFNINSQNPTKEIIGEGYTIKSNNDAMVYFYGRLNDNDDQKEIDFEKSKGKIVKITNFSRELIIDFGFKNYYSSKYPLNLYIRNDKVFYLDNLYDKLKAKLVPNEKLYIYGNKNYIQNIAIEYIEKNLNNDNNDYNIFLISPNDDKNTIIINMNSNYDQINPSIYYCKK